MSLKYCADEECSDYYTVSYWPMIRAYNEGWFMQRDGRAWCPRHIPAWVLVWRARKEKK